MTLYLRGKKWWYRREIGGREYRRPLGIDKGQPHQLVAEREAQMEARILALHYGLEEAPDRASILFSEYRPRYLKAKKHKATALRDRQRLDFIASVWPDLPLSFYGRSNVEALERQLLKAGPTGRPSKPATVNRYMELLRNLFNEAARDGLVRDNPLRFYEPYAEEGTRRALEEREIRAVLEAATELEKEKGFKLRLVFHDLILFALATGMRLSEILNLRRVWIRDEVVTIPLSATKSRRRGAVSKQRYKIVSLSPLARAIITRQPERDEYVFPLHRRDVMVIQHGIEAIRRLAGIPDFSFHFLRHTASTLIASQTSLATAKVVLGHADLKTTLRYTHPSLDEQRAPVTKLGTYLEGLSSK